MTHDQLKVAIGALGLSQLGAARLLGVGARTMRSWVAGDRPVPPTVARFITFMVVADVSPAEVERAVGS